MVLQSRKDRLEACEERGGFSLAREPGNGLVREYWRLDKELQMKVTFIGLGMMGKPMAVNHANAGTDLTVVNRSQGKVLELVGMGAKRGGSAAEASGEADVVCLCLSGEETVEEVLIDVLTTARPGTIVVDHSTIHPEVAKRLAVMCAKHAVVYLDAPVSGTGKVAWDGQLTIMVGGDREAFDKVKPALTPVSKAAYLVGPVGSGNTTKLLNNMIGDINQIAIMETFALASKLGLDVGVLLEVLQSASANSRQLERIGPKIVTRDFQQTSKLAGHLTNQEHTRWLADQAGLDLPLRNVAEAFWRRGVTAGYGEGDPVRSIELLEG
jgi:3-hydroxyisobutyrate dehydrogenase-like beta-hydroxyacid dehydrogenase